MNELESKPDLRRGRTGYKSISPGGGGNPSFCSLTGTVEGHQLDTTYSQKQVVVFFSAVCDVPPWTALSDAKQRWIEQFLGEILTTHRESYTHAFFL